EQLRHRRSCSGRRNIPTKYEKRQTDVYVEYSPVIQLTCFYFHFKLVDCSIPGIASWVFQGTKLHREHIMLFGKSRYQQGRVFRCSSRNYFFTWKIKF